MQMPRRGMDSHCVEPALGFAPAVPERESFKACPAFIRGTLFNGLYNQVIKSLGETAHKLVAKSSLKWRILLPASGAWRRGYLEVGKSIAIKPTACTWCSA
jgi:hypothetical protein